MSKNTSQQKIEELVQNFIDADDESSPFQICNANSLHFENNFTDLYLE